MFSQQQFEKFQIFIFRHVLIVFPKVIFEISKFYLSSRFNCFPNLPNQSQGRPTNQPREGGGNPADPPNQPTTGAEGDQANLPNQSQGRPTNQPQGGGEQHAATTQSGARIYHAAALQRRVAVTDTCNATSRRCVVARNAW